MEVSKYYGILKTFNLFKIMIYAFIYYFSLNASNTLFLYIYKHHNCSVALIISVSLFDSLYFALVVFLHFKTRLQRKKECFVSQSSIDLSSR